MTYNLIIISFSNYNLSELDVITGFKDYWPDRDQIRTKQLRNVLKIMFLSLLGAVHILVPYSDVSSSDVSFPPSPLIFLRALIVNRHSF